MEEMEGGEILSGAVLWFWLDYWRHESIETMIIWVTLAQNQACYHSIVNVERGP